MVGMILGRVRLTHVLRWRRLAGGSARGIILETVLVTLGIWRIFGTKF